MKRESFLTVAVVLAICLAALAGTATVFYQTRIANPTLDEYFSFLNAGRLLVLTHVHSFGYAVMGYILWTAGRRQGAAKSGWFGTILSGGVVAGILDVLSWWGIVYLSPGFRFLTFAAGGVFVGCILLSALIVILSCTRSAAPAAGRKSAEVIDGP